MPLGIPRSSMRHGALARGYGCMYNHSCFIITVNSECITVPTGYTLPHHTPTATHWHRITDYSSPSSPILPVLSESSTHHHQQHHTTIITFSHGPPHPGWFKSYSSSSGAFISSPIYFSKNALLLMRFSIMTFFHFPSMHRLSPCLFFIFLKTHRIYNKMHTYFLGLMILYFVG